MPDPIGSDKTECEIEITPEMIEAGVVALCSELPNYEFGDAEKRAAMIAVLMAVFEHAATVRLSFRTASQPTSSFRE
jgi:hypothetical protein